MDGSAHATLQVNVPWRPVQFLGSKLRSLDFIASALNAIDSTHGGVWDCFTGSSVVAQRLACDGYPVWATDALVSSSTFASAMLGVGRAGVQPGHLSEVAREVTDRVTLPECWLPWIAKERKALDEGDGPLLQACGNQLPQRWREGPRDERLNALFAEVEDAARSEEKKSSGLMSTTYAGTYFGIEQACVLEQIRGKIDEVAPCHDVNLRWVRASLITALCSAASSAVFSAGKHFAQPFQVRSGKDLSFHYGRLLQDRRITISEAFTRAAQEIEAHQSSIAKPHESSNRVVGSVTADDLVNREIRTVYADPPYTAQQYSRFYHVLEILSSSVPARLQRVRGLVTTGLYPDNKYLSPFSSRRQAPEAFRALMGTSRDAGANLILSYSDTRGAVTGNNRMVSLENLVEWTEHFYGKNSVTVNEFEFRYRQFNSSSSGLSGRNDPEVIVIGKANAS